MTVRMMKVASGSLAVAAFLASASGRTLSQTLSDGGAARRSLSWQYSSPGRAESARKWFGSMTRLHLSQKETGVVAASAGEISLGGGVTRVKLQPAEGEGNGTVASRIKSLKSGQRVYLVIRGLRAARQPGVLYQLYLCLPPEAKPAKNDARHAGTFDFYNAESFEPDDADENSSFGSYDVTDVLKRLVARGSSGDAITVSIVASGTPVPNAGAKIGRIELVVQ